MFHGSLNLILITFFYTLYSSYIWTICAYKWKFMMTVIKESSWWQLLSSTTETARLFWNQCLIYIVYDCQHRALNILIRCNSHIKLDFFNYNCIQNTVIVYVYLILAEDICWATSHRKRSLSKYLPPRWAEGFISQALIAKFPFSLTQETSAA